jgi:hypothetical protein
MSFKINIALAFFAFFALCNDAYIVQRSLRYEFPVKNLQQSCPKSSKLVFPEIAQVGLDSLFSTRIFKMLDMVVLPSREVCVLGEKLKNYKLPEKTQFYIMLSIAAWCFPCILDPMYTETERRHCLEQKLNFIVGDDNTKFKRFSERFVPMIQQYYYYKNVVTFFH